jgi:DNA repair protein RadC
VPIREWPESTRPRERLDARGAASLSDDELLALLIGSATRRRSALLIANEALRQVGGARAVGQADISVCATPASAPRPRRVSPPRASSAGA